MGSAATLVSLGISTQVVAIIWCDLAAKYKHVKLTVSRWARVGNKGTVGHSSKSRSVIDSQNHEHWTARDWRSTVLHTETSGGCWESPFNQCLVTKYPPHPPIHNRIPVTLSRPDACRALSRQLVSAIIFLCSPVSSVLGNESPTQT